MHARLHEFHIYSIFFVTMYRVGLKSIVKSSTDYNPNPAVNAFTTFILELFQKKIENNRWITLIKCN